MLYHLLGNIEGPDQVCGYRAADLCFSFSHIQVFLLRDSFIYQLNMSQ